MKKFMGLTVLLVVWLAIVPASASADGPVWQWAARQQRIKEIGGWVYRLGSSYPQRFSSVKQQLQQQGYYEQSWSTVGGSNIAYHLFVRMARVPVAPIIMIAPMMFLQQTNPLYFPPRTG